MKKIFGSSFFSANRAELRKSTEAGVPIVITAHGLLQRNADNVYPFRQDSNFWYLTGIDEPDLILVMDGHEEYIMVPGRNGSREAFDGAIDFAEMSHVSGIKDIMSEEDGWQRLGKRLKDAGKVQTLQAPSPYIEQYGMYTNPARARLIERLLTWQQDAEVIDIRGALVTLRSIKQPEELAAIQSAIDITIAGIQEVTSPMRLDNYTYEFEIENSLTTAFRTKVSGGHAFPPIVAGGKRGVTLHNVTNSGKLASGDLVVIDVGAEVSHYAADITRTVALGNPTKRQKEIFDTVKDVQAYALGLLKPGAALKEYEAAVEEYMGGQLRRLGLVTEVSHEAVRKFYLHATSHFLGLDVHDVGDYKLPLKPGMVLTCEPGIYIPEEGIGVRIEDDVLITEKGNTVLSAALPINLTGLAA